MGKQLECRCHDDVASFNAQPNWFALHLRAESKERWRFVNEAYEWEMDNDPLKSRRGW